ncbi:hypothetical protein CL629_01995 [bacterium]|nr:hypothetical protein [bacterium]
MTKKKTLLEEGTVRQFMKLADLRPLAGDFVGRLYEGEDVQEEEVKEEGKDVQEEEVKEEGKDVQKEELEVEDEVEDEVGLEDPGLGGPEEELDVTALVQAIADAVEEHTGVAIEVAGDADEELGLGDEEEEVELDDLGGEEEVVDVEAEEEVEEGPPLEEIVSAIAENVTARLKTLAKKKVKG